MLSLAYTHQQSREIEKISKILYPEALRQETGAASTKLVNKIEIAPTYESLAIESFMKGFQLGFKKETGQNIWEFIYKRIFKTDINGGIINTDKLAEKTDLLAPLCALWKLSKNIFRLDPDVANLLLKTSIKNQGQTIPFFGLDKIPYWSVYIDTGILVEDKSIDGLLITSGSSFTKGTPFNKVQLLVYAFGRPEGKLWGIYKNNGKTIVAHFDDEFNVYDYKDITKQPDFCFILNVLLYINTYLQTIYNENNNSLPQNPKPKRKSGKLRWQEASKNTVWKVGVEVGEQIRAYNRTHTSSTHGSPSPHIRRAHWHTYLTGPRTNPVPILKWIPPIPIAMPRENQNNGNNRPS
jgi:hypothetical protein